MQYKAVVIGVSSGGLNVLTRLLPELPADFCLPVIIVQHVSPLSDSSWVKLLDDLTAVRVKEADEKEKVQPGVVYFAPPNYHLLVEKDETLSLTIDERVNFARPSIDVLFESAAVAYGEALVGIVLTGANNDGAQGMKRIREYGGLTIVQAPATAEASYMPQAVLDVTPVDHIAEIEKIIYLLNSICE